MCCGVDLSERAQPTQCHSTEDKQQLNEKGRKIRQQAARLEMLVRLPAMCELSSVRAMWKSGNGELYIMEWPGMPGCSVERNLSLSGN